MSPEAIPLFQSCRVDHHAWTDHSTVVANFCGGLPELCRYPWPLALAIPWDKLADRAEDSFVDFCASQDLDASYQQLWADVEQCAQVCADAHGRPLRSQQLGRGARLQPDKVSTSAPPVPAGRKGDCQPSYFGSSWQHAHMFRQVRRLQSYVRHVRSGTCTPSHHEHKAALWRSILHAPGFVASFPIWWQQQVECWSLFPEVPIDPPMLDTAVVIFDATHCLVQSFEKALQRHRAYVNRRNKGFDMQQVYAAVKRDPPAPVEVLLHSSKGEVTKIDHDDVAVELRSEVVWDDALPLIHQGRSLAPIFVSPDKIWLESVDGIAPRDEIVQHSGLGRLEDLFQAFTEQISLRLTFVLWLLRLFVGPSPFCVLLYLVRRKSLLVAWMVFLVMIWLR